ncbi:MAG: hypothetical protein ABFD08_09435 [Syntrophomonas sp.]
MERFTPEAVQEWIEFASQNAQAIKDLLKDEKDEQGEIGVAGVAEVAGVTGCGRPPVPSPCCCPNIVKLIIFALDVDIYTAACPDFVA